MFNAFSKELLKRLESIHRGLLTGRDDRKLSGYFNDKQITALNDPKKLIAKVYKMENPSTIIEAARKGDLAKLTKLLEDKNGMSGKGGNASTSGKKKSDGKVSKGSNDINAQDKLGLSQSIIINLKPERKQNM